MLFLCFCICVKMYRDCDPDGVLDFTHCIIYCVFVQQCQNYGSLICHTTRFQLRSCVLLLTVSFLCVCDVIRCLCLVWCWFACVSVCRDTVGSFRLRAYLLCAFAGFASSVMSLRFLFCVVSVVLLAITSFRRVLLRYARTHCALESVSVGIAFSNAVSLRVDVFRDVCIFGRRACQRVLQDKLILLCSL